MHFSNNEGIFTFISLLVYDPTYMIAAFISIAAQSCIVNCTAENNNKKKSAQSREIHYIFIV